MTESPQLTAPSTTEINMRFVTPGVPRTVRNRGPVLQEDTLNGVLRFWARTVYPLNKVDAVFGSAADSTPVAGNPDSSPGQKRFTLAVRGLPRPEPVTRRNLYRGHDYWFPPGGEVKIGLTPRPGNDIHRIVCDAFWLLCHFGGVGSGQRRGHGSLQLVGADPPKDLDALSNEITDRFKGVKAYGVRQDHPTFCPGAWVYALKPADGWSSSLLGALKILKDFARGLGPWEKAVFGLPRRDLSRRDPFKERRASPVHLHVHPVGKGVVTIVTYMPTKKFHASKEVETTQAMVDKIVASFKEHITKEVGRVLFEIPEVRS